MPVTGTGNPDTLKPLNQISKPQLKEHRARRFEAVSNGFQTEMGFQLAPLRV